MSKNYFRLYIWLIETISSREKITLKEIKYLWLKSSLNDDYCELSTRTFHNHVNAIFDVFGIEIKCDRRAVNIYRQLFRLCVTKKFWRLCTKALICPSHARCY